MLPSDDFVVLKRAVIAGWSCCVVSALVHPLDVVKIRLQNQKTVIYKSMLSGISKIYREEGFSGLLKGLNASMCREASYSTVRFGAYDPFRKILSGSESNSQDIAVHIKFLSGLLSGGIGAALANPFDLVKTRFQSLLPGESLPYSSTFRTLVDIFQLEGISGLYKGWPVTTCRAAVLTSAQIGSYDAIKNNVLIKFCGMEDGFVLHSLASMSAGVITTTAANPIDVIKTRYMSDRIGLYKSPIQCAFMAFKEGGLFAFFKGWMPAYWRLGPHTILSFILIEKIRIWLGLGSI